MSGKEKNIQDLQKVLELFADSTNNKLKPEVSELLISLINNRNITPEHKILRNKIYLLLDQYENFRKIDISMLESLLEIQERGVNNSPSRTFFNPEDIDDLSRSFRDHISINEVINALKENR